MENGRGKEEEEEEGMTAIRSPGTAHGNRMSQGRLFFSVGGTSGVHGGVHGARRLRGRRVTRWPRRLPTCEPLVRDGLTDYVIKAPDH